MSSLWICPQCGRRLRVRNQEHTCARYSLESHFDGKDPLARELFDRLMGDLRCADVDVLPLKTFIALQARSNFAFIRCMKKGVELSLVLSRVPSFPAPHRTDAYGPKKWIVRFRLNSMTDFTEGLEALAHEALTECSDPVQGQGAET